MGLALVNPYPLRRRCRSQLASRTSRLRQRAGEALSGEELLGRRSVIAAILRALAKEKMTWVSD
jgi:hypothetical protein